jgi:hypothetical protein
MKTYRPFNFSDYSTACLLRDSTRAGFATPVSESDQSEPYLRATNTAAAAGQRNRDGGSDSTEEARPGARGLDGMAVIPEVTETAREIYRKGVAMGNNPKAFSKVGDCQNVREAFLGFFDHPGKYEDMTGIGAMQDTINILRILRPGRKATKYGFNAAAVLSPLWADRRCACDETPLECELRITRRALC